MPTWMQPDWIPDWFVDAQRPARPEPGPFEDTVTGLPPAVRRERLLSSVSNASQLPPLPTTDADPPNDDVFIRREKFVVVTPSKDRTVHRKLGGFQLAMITVNATLGTGLYWRGGEILELGGPLAVILSYLFPGFLAWAAMQCITEMLCIWPIPGALAVYVSEFVDVELGIAVGVAYWFAYSSGFAALIAISAAEIYFSTGPQTTKAFEGGVVYFLIPLVLVFINCFRVDIFGWFEVFTSSLKILFLLVIFAFLIAIKLGAGGKRDADQGNEANADWQSPIRYDHSLAQNWAISLFMCISIATFAYVGVEVVAASALEARWPDRQDRIPTDLSQRSDQDLLIGKTVKFAAVYMPAIFTVVYILSGLLATLNIPRRDPRLSVLGKAPKPIKGTSTSVFVSIAHDSAIPHLPNIFNGFLIFTALSCANTNLYVASRTLFGLTSTLDGGSRQSRLLRILAWLGRTNRRKVPIRAIVVSALAFCWVPFLQLHDGNGIENFIDILATMSSGGLIIVWICESWAFIRFYHCIYRHRKVLEAQKIPQVRRWDMDDYDDYPYRSHLQPFLAYVALAGSLFILIVAEGSDQWAGFVPNSFLSSYVIVFAFLILWVLLKIVRGANWELVDLHNETKVIYKIQQLHDIRLGAS